MIEGIHSEDEQTDSGRNWINSEKIKMGEENVRYANMDT